MVDLFRQLWCDDNFRLNYEKYDGYRPPFLCKGQRSVNSYRPHVNRSGNNDRWLWQCQRGKYWPFNEDALSDYACQWCIFWHYGVVSVEDCSVGANGSDVKRGNALGWLSTELWDSPAAVGMCFRTQTLINYYSVQSQKVVNCKHVRLRADVLSVETLKMDYLHIK